MSRKKMIRCNFCGKTTKQIGFVIQGTALTVETHICKNCADICIELFQEKENLKSFSNSKLNILTIEILINIFNLYIYQFFIGKVIRPINFLYY